jgi:hypothetical protein
VAHREGRTISIPRDRTVIAPRRAAAFTGRKRLLPFNKTMAQIRMDVRDSLGQPLPALCDEFLDLRLPVDHARLAQGLLRMLRDDRGQSAAHSVHLIRDDAEIGSWSLRREQAETTREIAASPSVAA